MTAPFVRVLVFCKLKLTRHSLGAVVVMKSGTIAKGNRDVTSLNPSELLAKGSAICFRRSLSPLLIDICDASSHSPTWGRPHARNHLLRAAQVREHKDW